jgi:Mg2+/Co2+ transporter CorC
LPTEESDTLGGVIYNLVGRVPAMGEQVRVGNLLLTVEQVSGRRIRKVRARAARPDDQDGEQPAEAGEGTQVEQPEDDEKHAGGEHGDDDHK